LRTSFALGLIVAVVAACAGGSPSPVPSGSPPPTGQSTSAPIPTASPESELSVAIRIRTELGLNADPDYVAQVQNDPTSVMSDLGILVTPDELRQLSSNQAAPDDISALLAYAVRHSDEFGGLYRDVATGHFVMLFTGHVDDHQTAIRLLRRGAGVEVRECRYTEAALRAIQQEIADNFAELQAQGIQIFEVSLDTINNVVAVQAQSNDPAARSKLESPYDGKVIANVLPLPGAWSNNMKGDGWQLLAALERSAEWAYRVGVATSQDEWKGLWQQLSPGMDAPAIDFENEIAVVFGEAHGSSCPDVRFDNLVIDRAQAVVHDEVSNPLGPIPCTADLSGAQVFVLAVAREALPPMPFTVQLKDVPACCLDTGRVTVGNN
jgi:hypothetical protein